MIGKAKCISHLDASMEYASMEEKGSEELARNHLIGTVKEFPDEMKLLHQLNYRCRNNTIRIELSPAIEDLGNLSEEDWRKLPREFIGKLQSKLGANVMAHQWVAFKHEKAGPDNNIDRPHVHIYINRIDFQGKAIPDKFIGKKAQVAAHELAKEKGLVSARDKMVDKIEKERPKQLRKILLGIAQKSTDLDQFIERSSRKGIEISKHFNLQNELGGLKVSYEGQSYKISQIDRSLTLKRINQIFSTYGKERDRQL